MGARPNVFAKTWSHIKIECCIIILDCTYTTFFLTEWEDKHGGISVLTDTSIEYFIKPSCVVTFLWFLPAEHCERKSQLPGESPAEK